jgi:ribosomal-protein-alanine N-acetyltransferase
LNQPYIFKTERLIVRQYVFETDADNFFAINGDNEVMRYIREAKGREECDKFLKENIEAYKVNPMIGRWLAVDKNTNEFIGSFAIIPIEGTEQIQLGYALPKESWGKGYASELTKGGLEYYFRVTKEDYIYAIAEKANTASHNVLYKNGFVLIEEYKEGDKGVVKFIYKKIN